MFVGSRVDVERHKTVQTYKLIKGHGYNRRMTIQLRLTALRRGQCPSSPLGVGVLGLLGLAGARQLLLRDHGLWRDGLPSHHQPVSGLTALLRNLTPGRRTH